MTVRPSQLENPERDLRLATREPEAAETADARELRELRERLEEARKLKPEDQATPGKLRHLHCSDCFARGRDAAIRKIEGEPRG